MQGQLYVVSAPSGAGKTSLVNALIETIDGVMISVSNTTREPREGEINGKHYHFTEKADFQQRIQQGDFLEYAEVFGNYYGTSKSAVDASLQSGQDVILEIDWQGAAQIRKRFDDVISIFILPPSYEELENRLRGRSTDADDVIKRRLSEAMGDMKHCQHFDYIVINGKFEHALNELASIFLAQRLRTNRVIECDDPFVKSVLEPVSKI